MKEKITSRSSLRHYSYIYLNQAELRVESVSIGKDEYRQIDRLLGQGRCLQESVYFVFYFLIICIIFHYFLNSNSRKFRTVDENK